MDEEREDWLETVHKMEQTDKISLKNNEGERSMMLHCKHNSLVDFSFLDKGTNARKCIILIEATLHA